MKDTCSAFFLRLGYAGFSSLQTGRCMQRTPYDQRASHQWQVSIPFKREGVLRALEEIFVPAGWSMDVFQFPSNGKVCCELTDYDMQEYVDIWFQFPSNGKVCCEDLLTTWNGLMILCFNSLQTGRYVASFYSFRVGLGFVFSFQFPSNGKVRCEIMIGALAISFISGVSIPFKREGVLRGVLRKDLDRVL